MNCAQTHAHVFIQVECVETGGLLSSLYLLLENIITYLTSGPSLKLDDRQVKQLHSAMVGAFNAVIFFLSEIATKYIEKVGTCVQVYAELCIMIFSNCHHSNHINILSTFSL